MQEVNFILFHVIHYIIIIDNHIYFTIDSCKRLQIYCLAHCQILVMNDIWFYLPVYTCFALYLIKQSVFLFMILQSSLRINMQKKCR